MSLSILLIAVRFLIDLSIQWGQTATEPIATCLSASINTWIAGYYYSWGRAPTFHFKVCDCSVKSRNQWLTLDILFSGDMPLHMADTDNTTDNFIFSSFKQMFIICNAHLRVKQWLTMDGWVIWFELNLMLGGMTKKMFSYSNEC